MRKILLLIVLSFLTLPILASPLDDAKKSGQVVEVSDGYVKAQPSASTGAIALVKDINARRKEAYSRIAKENGVSTEKIAAESYKKRLEN
ncbi:MAG: hypothetical protein ACI9FB_001043 [Candidatus Azotimanducaceae bacterium]|jgi:uncharacterized protein YdbL (DUF1318 family)